MCNSLADNPVFSEQDLVDNSNLLFRTEKTPEDQPPVLVFKFMQMYGDKTGTKKIPQFKEPRLIKSSGKWFVTYSYLVPTGFPGAGKWKRFKVYEDINRHKNNEYSQALLDAVKRALDSGWSPFDHAKRFMEAPQKIWSINQGFLHFIKKWSERGLTEATMKKYERAVKGFLKWMTKYSMQNLPVSKVETSHIERYLQERKLEKKWSNRTYNNEMDFLDTACKFLVKEKLISSNPVEDLHQPKTSSKKHRYYDQKTLEKLVTIMKKEDPYLYFAFQCVYHLCVRSEKELKNMKVGNIFPDRMQVLLTAGETKTNADRFIPMSDEILRIFNERSILSFPENYYVFGVPHKNRWIPDGVPGPEPFGNGFFSKRFAKIRKKAGLSSDFTIYGAKHTRVIHLKKDGAKDDEIMSLTGHKDFTSYSSYLRDLGVDANVEKLSAITRAI